MLGTFSWRICLHILIKMLVIWNVINIHAKKVIKTSTNIPKKSFSPFLFLPASIMHLTSRCLIFLALNFTTASSFQMLSGSNLIFTCILSRIFLKKTLDRMKIIGVSIVLSWSKTCTKFRN